MAGYRNWVAREKAIIDYIESSQPDVILLQEVHFDPMVSPFDQAATTNNKLGKPYEFCHSSISRFYTDREGKSRREGLASLSRWPVVRSETLALTKHPDDKHFRIIQTITVKAPDLSLEIMNVHFSNNDHSREHLEEVYGIAANHEQWPLIIGDFNIFQLSDYHALYEKAYNVSSDFKNYVSFPSEKLTLDYLLLPKTFRFQAIDVKESLSDHNATLYTIESIK